MPPTAHHLPAAPPHPRGCSHLPVQWHVPISCSPHPRGCPLDGVAWEAVTSTGCGVQHLATVPPCRRLGQPSVLEMARARGHRHRVTGVPSGPDIEAALDDSGNGWPRKWPHEDQTEVTPVPRALPTRPKGTWTARASTDEHALRAWHCVRPMRGGRNIPGAAGATCPPRPPRRSPGHPGRLASGDCGQATALACRRSRASPNRHSPADRPYQKGRLSNARAAVCRHAHRVHSPAPRRSPFSRRVSGRRGGLPTRNHAEPAPIPEPAASTQPAHHPSFFSTGHGSSGSRGDVRPPTTRKLGADLGLRTGADRRWGTLDATVRYNSGRSRWFQQLVPQHLPLTKDDQLVAVSQPAPGRRDTKERGPCFVATNPSGSGAPAGPTSAVADAPDSRPPWWR